MSNINHSIQSINSTRIRDKKTQIQKAKCCKTKLK